MSDKVRSDVAQLYVIIGKLTVENQILRAQIAQLSAPPDEPENTPSED